MNKSCSTCDRRIGDRCNVTGYYIETERKYPRDGACDIDFSRWEPRRGAIQRFKDWLFGVKA